jgi:ankyrin repeat protein
MTKNDVRSLKDALNSLPEGLSATYDEAMERIKSQSSDDYELAMKVLYWIHYALRPLTLEEIQNGLAVRPGDHKIDEEGISDEERLLSVCAGMVAIQNESRTISLVHHSAQEYFKRKAIEHFPRAQDDIAAVCLTYLLFENFEAGPCASDEDLETRLQKYPFLEYAANYWGNHFSQGSRRDKDLVLGFLEEASKSACCIQIIHKNILRPPVEQRRRHQRFKECQQSLRDVHSLWLAAYFGLTDIIEVMLGKGMDVMMKTGYGETALHPAARRGNEAAVKALIAAEVDINAVNENGSSPLQIAAHGREAGESHLSGHEVVVRILIEEGAEVTAKDLYSYTALHLAADNGNMTVVKLLLENRADVDAKEEDNWTALHLAAQNGHEAVVELLLERGADVTARSTIGSTVLHLAAQNGYEVVVNLLLKHGADIEARENTNSSAALHLAAKNGAEAVIKLLLENGANIEAKDKDGSTALFLAAVDGHEAVVRLLLKNGADIEAKDDINWTTVLTASAQYGHEAVVKLLLEEGADIEAKEKEDWTALHAAAQHGHKAVVKLLLEKGANALLTSSAGRTALHLAAEDGHEATVKLLLENGADIAAIDEMGWTALRLAAWKGHEAVVKLVLENGVDIEVRGENGRTALHAAAENGHQVVVKQLLENGADVKLRIETV